MAEMTVYRVDCWCKRTLHVPGTATLEHPHVCGCGRKWYVADSSGGPVPVLAGGPGDLEVVSSAPWWHAGNKCLAALFWVEFTGLWFLLAAGFLKPSYGSASLAVFLFLGAVAAPYTKRRE